MLDYADFLECHVDSWTVTDAGTLLPDVPRHYIRIHPTDGDALIEDSLRVVDAQLTVDTSASTSRRPSANR